MFIESVFHGNPDIMKTMKRRKSKGKFEEKSTVSTGDLSKYGNIISNDCVLIPTASLLLTRAEL